MRACIYVKRERKFALDFLRYPIVRIISGKIVLQHVNFTRFRIPPPTASVHRQAIFFSSPHSRFRVNNQSSSVVPCTGWAVKPFLEFSGRHEFFYPTYFSSCCANAWNYSCRTLFLILSLKICIHGSTFEPRETKSSV